MKLLTNALGALMEIFGWKREREQRANTPEMQANARGAQDVRAVDDARAAVKKADVNDIRGRLS